MDITNLLCPGVSIVATTETLFKKERWYLFTRLITEVCNQQQRAKIAQNLKSDFKEKLRKNELPDFVMDAFLDYMYPHYDYGVLFNILFVAICHRRKNHVIRFLKNQKLVSILLSDSYVRKGIVVLFNLWSYNDDCDMVELFFDTQLAPLMFDWTCIPSYVITELCVKNPRIQDILLQHKVPLDDDAIRWHIYGKEDDPNYISRLVTSMIKNGYVLSQKTLDAARVPVTQT